MTNDPELDYSASSYQIKMEKTTMKSWGTQWDSWFQSSEMDLGAIQTTTHLILNVIFYLFTFVLAVLLKLHTTCAMDMSFPLYNSLARVM